MTQKPKGQPVVVRLQAAHVSARSILARLQLLNRIAVLRMTQRPVLIVNPRDDAVFRDLVEHCVDEGVKGMEALQAALRERYPLAVVHLREISSEQAVVWYVYRDGRWIGRCDAREG
jgi:hypothetical protein